MTQTGQVYYRDEDGALWLAVSYVDAKGVVTTQATLIPEDDQ
jgi:hypothetical protein